MGSIEDSLLHAVHSFYTVDRLGFTGTRDAIAGVAASLCTDMSDDCGRQFVPKPICNSCTKKCNAYFATAPLVTAKQAQC